MSPIKIKPVSGGTVTSPRGFCAGATYAGIKKNTDDALDLAILFSEAPCMAVGLFTNNKIKSAPVLLCQQKLQNGRAVAVVVNSGCANASMGELGLADAAEMATLTANAIGAEPEDIPIGGVAKGSGMIHPDLATMLCFLTTDAAVELEFLKSALRKAADASFDMVSIDGDTSPSDTLLIMANGLAGNEPISHNSDQADIFQQALDQVCLYLAKSIARDGEGATRLIEVTVNGAINDDEARLAARTVVSSPLVKAAVHGCDPNWGRILAAVGRSGAEVVESKINLTIGDVNLVKGGTPLPFSKQTIAGILGQSEVPISLNLNLGTASATAWGCDLSEEYVVINSQYTT